MKIKIFLKIATFFLIFLSIFIVSCKKSEKADEQWQNQYRSYYHVKTLQLKEGHPLYEAFGGIHHVYANQKAFLALKNKTSFPVGSILVFDLLEAVENQNSIAEGERKILAIMKKTSDNSATGGWEFKAYKKGDLNQQIVKDPLKECFQCHQQREKNDYVFSEWRP